YRDGIVPNRWNAGGLHQHQPLDRGLSEIDSRSVHTPSASDSTVTNIPGRQSSFDKTLASSNG
ncbi:MAG: hypothetical protein LM549_17820, partial [Candidatus Competibacter sp.]|nr:hypothetical protein [Candidatus Competibacter sp.]